MSATKQNIVIVGGGGVGSALARSLSTTIDSSKHTLTLITARPYHVYLPAQLRTMVDEKSAVAKDSWIPFDKLFINGNGVLKVGKVTTIEVKEGGKGGAVVLENGDRVRYDALVLASGAIWEGPLAIPDEPEAARAHIASWRSKFADASHVVMAGGGAVGVELAGELKDKYPTKKITIVQGSSQLLNPAFPPKFRKYLEQQVRARGVELIFEDFIDKFPTPETTTIKTRKGTELVDVLVVPARGGRPNTAFIGSSLGAAVLNEHRQVKVRPSLQLVDHDNIFAVGDITDVKEQKHAHNNGVYASVVAANVTSVLDSQKPAKHYKGLPEFIVVGNGANSGAAYMPFLWGLVFGPWFARMIKTKHLFLPMTRKGMGL